MPTVAHAVEEAVGGIVVYTTPAGEGIGTTPMQCISLLM
jgi:hypothetical protein